MERKLERISHALYHYDDAGSRRDGPHSGLSGNMSGISGNVDACNLTPEDRQKGVHIQD